MIDPLPLPPTRTDPVNFAARADAFLGALTLFGQQLNEAATIAAQAAQTAVNAPGTMGTSTTPLSILVGYQNFITQTGKSFATGLFAIMVSRSAPENYMVGQISGYDPANGSIVLNALAARGSGIHSDWNIALTASFDPSRILVANGSSDAPSLGFAEESGMGFYRLGQGQLAARYGFIRLTYTDNNFSSRQTVVNANSGVQLTGNEVNAASHSFYSNFGAALVIDTSGTTRPGGDNILTLGSDAYRFAGIKLGSAPSVTSDASEKTVRGSLTTAEIAAALDIEAAITAYQMNDAMALKGSNGARLHIGLIAQTVRDILISHRLDWTRYGLIGHDTWTTTDAIPETPAIRDESGEIVVPHFPGSPARPAGDRFSLRYEETLMFIAAGNRAARLALEARIAALEAA